MVVVSIIGIISGLGMVGYNDFNDRERVRQSTETMKSHLQATRSRALTGHKPVGWCQLTGQSLSAWRLRVTSTTTYQAEGVCSTGLVSSPSFLITLPSGVTITTSTQVDFSSITGASGGGTFTLQGRVAGADYTKSITVRSSGEVE